MRPLRALLEALAATLRRLRADTRGNVLMLMGFSVIPLTAATGIAIDYSHAAQLQTRMNAAADAAALAAVGKPMSQEVNSVVQDMAKKVFNAQVSDLKGVTYNQADLTVTITGGVGASNTRTAVVTYTARSKNAFGGVLGMSTVLIGGTSTATSSQAPNIDFYLLLDTSPSMLIPAEQAGLDSLTAATGGCAFACHQTNLNYSKGVNGVPDNTELVCNSQNKNCKDYYSVASTNGIKLRTDLLNDAVENLMDVASTTSTQNGAKYRMGLSSFDYKFKNVFPTSASGGFFVEANLATVKTHADDATVLPYCMNNYRVCGTNDNDQATNFSAAFTGALATMPVTPGEGTNVAPDTPEAILFLITDGMRDENVGGSRTMGPIPLTQCDTIKARKIRIAILHTEYLPDSASDSWSISNVKTPYLSPTDRISPALVQCASPGLYYQVTTGNDISGALAALFQKAVSTAHLTR